MKQFVVVGKVAGVFAGVIIGAGFASGKELMQFFLRYQEKWILGMFLAGAMFALLGSMLLTTAQACQPKNYRAFMELLGGKRAGGILEWISGAFLCILFFTMAAASGAVAEEAFSIPAVYGTVLLLVCCFFVFSCGGNGLVAVNTILTPLMMLSGIVLGAYALQTHMQSAGAFWQNGMPKWKWAFSALLYVSYNSITAVPILLSLGKELPDKKTGVYAGVLGGLCMGILGASIGLVLYLDGTGTEALQLPILKVLETYGQSFRFLYLFMLAAAIFTTAVGNGFGALLWLGEKTSLPPVIWNITLLVAAFLFSFLGFDGFVERVYPLFGYLGLIEIFLLLRFCLR